MMIAASLLKRLCSMDEADLTELIRKAGYLEDKFTGCKFLGLTGKGYFCYFAVFISEAGGTDSCKVYVNFDRENGTITAEY